MVDADGGRPSVLRRPPEEAAWGPRWGHLAKVVSIVDAARRLGGWDPD